MKIDKFYFFLVTICIMSIEVFGQELNYLYAEQNVQVGPQSNLSEQKIGFYLPLFIPPNILGSEASVTQDNIIETWPTTQIDNLNPNPGLYYSQNRRGVYRELFYQIILYADPEYDYYAAKQLIDPIIDEWPSDTDPNEILQDIKMVSTVGTFGSMLNSNIGYITELTKAGLSAEEAEFRAILSFVALSTFAETRMELIERHIKNATDPEMKNGFYLAKRDILEDLELDKEELSKAYRSRALGQSLSKGLVEKVTSGIVGVGVKALLAGAGTTASFTALALPAALLHGLNRDSKRNRSEAMAVGLANIDNHIFRNYMVESGLESQLMGQMGYRVQKMITDLAGEYRSLIEQQRNYADGRSGRDYRSIASEANNANLDNIKPSYNYAIISDYVRIEAGLPLHYKSIKNDNKYILNSIVKGSIVNELGSYDFIAEENGTIKLNVNDMGQGVVFETMFEDSKGHFSIVGPYVNEKTSLDNRTHQKESIKLNKFGIGVNQSEVSNLHIFILPLPSRGFQPEKQESFSWSDADNGSFSQFGNVEISSVIEMDYEFVGKETFAGQECYKFLINGKVRGQFVDQIMEGNTTTDVVGQYYIDSNEYFIVGYEVQLDMGSDVNLNMSANLSVKLKN